MPVTLGSMLRPTAPVQGSAPSCCTLRATPSFSGNFSHTQHPTVGRRHHRALTVQVRAERSRSSAFLSGFVLGGAVFGALGFLFAPQISSALLSEDQRLKLPRFLEEEEKDPEATRQDLADKIASLNSAIDDVSSQLKAQDAAANVDPQQALT